MSELTKTISFQEFLTAYEGQRAEWIMGDVELRMSTNAVHQAISVFLTSLFNLYLGVTSAGKIFTASFPMYISDEQPAREPDLIIVLNANLGRIQTNYLDGPADLAIEIVSPESTQRDFGAKFAEYEAAGVREYWIIDPQRKIVDLNVLTDEGVYQRHPQDADGHLTSSVLPSFYLKADWLWQDEPPAGMQLVELVQQMTKT